MTPQSYFRAQRRVFMFAAAVLLLLAAPVAFAGWIAINTNNGQVDSIGAANYTSTCSNGTIADYLEIRNAWISNDGSGFYFRIEACAPAQAGSEIQGLRLGAGFDCNNDGDVVDPYIAGPDGDRKGVYWPNPTADQTWLYDGQNNPITQMPDNSYGERIGANYEWWIPLDKLYPGCRASSSGIGLAAATAQLSGGVPQTRDITPLYLWNHPIDYGDANNPDPMALPPTCTQYPTRIGCNGARHGLNSLLLLGAQVDPDGGNEHGPDVNGDDLDNLPDEDGVAPTEGMNWVAGGQGSLTAAVSGGNGYLNCWIDWNANTSWAESGERVVSDVAVSVGATARTFGVPAGISFPGAFTARCRLAPGVGQATTVTGPVEFGEVEDHKWAFGATGNRPGPVTVAATYTSPSTDVTLSWNNVPSNESYRVLSSPRPYFAPGDGDVTTVTPASSPLLVTGVAGNAADANVFWVVQGEVTTSTPDLLSRISNRAGLFEFGLISGTP